MIQRALAYALIGALVIGALVGLNYLPEFFHVMAHHEDAFDWCRAHQPPADTMIEWGRHVAECEEYANRVAPLNR
jgi:hypothetical protein